MTQLQCPMGYHGYHAVLCDPNRFIFGDNIFLGFIVVPLNNFASMSNCPWVQGKSNSLITTPPKVCVGGWGQIVVP